MSKNILLIVEGKKDEKNIFGDVFLKYGFNTVVSEQPIDVQDIGQFDKYQYSSSKDNIVIIQGPKNRIHDFLKLYNQNEEILEKYFSYSYGFFTAIFLIYDVDHNDCDDVNEMFKKFSDESSGLLLLSSPCIEVLGDYNRNRKEEKYHHLKEYKTDINTHFNGMTFFNIKENFDSIMVYFLMKNFEDFHDGNIMNHPGLIVQKINELNERANCEDKEKSYVIYRYFSTVVYVAIAQAKGLTKEIDNYQAVLDFFVNHDAK